MLTTVTNKVIKEPKIAIDKIINILKINEQNILVFLNLPSELLVQRKLSQHARIDSILRFQAF